MVILWVDLNYPLNVKRRNVLKIYSSALESRG